MLQLFLKSVPQIPTPRNAPFRRIIKRALWSAERRCRCPFLEIYTAHSNNEGSEKSCSKEIHLILFTKAFLKSEPRPSFLKAVDFKIHSAGKETEAWREEVIWLKPKTAQRERLKLNPRTYSPPSLPWNTKQKPSSERAVGNLSLQSAWPEEWSKKWKRIQPTHRPLHRTGRFCVS